MTFQLNVQPPLLDQSNRNPQADRHPILEQKQIHNMLNMLIDIKYAKYVKYATFMHGDFMHLSMLPWKHCIHNMLGQSRE